ncbi:ABC transporter ATP-binding protein [Maritalea sp.]|uniref:ABC transporter ATP-binding protein n=1 Tax=Maritalea sp. TaxID=2003361 RepID=UPI003EFA9371
MIQDVNSAPIISLSELSVGFGDRLVLDGLSFSIRRGDVVGVIGPSGCGKSVSMRALLGLVPTRSGLIEILGKDLAKVEPKELVKTRQKIGVLFQQGALFSSLTVQENVELPMREHFRLNPDLIGQTARAKIEMAGLPKHAANLYPSELSGGMIKRAALARALALDPQLLFLDEPTAGLDPIGAAAFDNLILELRAAFDLTVFMITHDLDSLGAICDDLVVLSKGKLMCQGTLNEVRMHDDPWIKQYFGGPRARRIGEK